jgi:hypothetical protein
LGDETPEEDSHGARAQDDDQSEQTDAHPKEA